MVRTASQQRPHVLIVDDDEDVRFALRALLEDEGYVVEEAAEGQLALDRLRASAQGLIVLLDVNMPRMDGIQVMRTVADQEPLATRHAYVVDTALNELLTPVVVEFLSGLGASIVAKPFDIYQLLAVITEAAQRLGHEHEHVSSSV